MHVNHNSHKKMTISNIIHNKFFIFIVKFLTPCTYSILLKFFILNISTAPSSAHNWWLELDWIDPVKSIVENSRILYMWMHLLFHLSPIKTSNPQLICFELLFNSFNLKKKNYKVFRFILQLIVLLLLFCVT